MSVTVTVTVQVVCARCGETATRVSTDGSADRFVAAALRSIERRGGWDLARPGRFRRSRTVQDLCPVCASTPEHAREDLPPADLDMLLPGWVDIDEGTGQHAAPVAEADTALLPRQ